MAYPTIFENSLFYPLFGPEIQEFVTKNEYCLSATIFRSRERLESLDFVQMMFI